MKFSIGADFVLVSLCSPSGYSYLWVLVVNFRVAIP